MSLLLDALKKAAEKKAQKNAEDADRLDSSTKISAASESAKDDVKKAADLVADDAADQEDQTSSSLDDTAISDFADGVTETIPVDLSDTSEIENTAIEATQLDATEVNDTSFEQTQLDSTELDETEIERTNIDNTVIDNTELESTQIDSAADVTSREDKTDFDRTEIDITYIDTTEFKADEYERTEKDKISDTDAQSDESSGLEVDNDRTEIDITSIDTTEFKSDEYEKTEIDSTQKLEIEIDDAADKSVDVERTEIDDAQFRTTEYDISDNDITQTNTEISEITGEDRTLLIFDEDETGIEFPSLDDLHDEDLTRSDETEKSLENHVSDDEQELTSDDVTEFMGDGLRLEDEMRGNPQSKQDVESTAGQDDTTVTNTDSLSLTQVEFDGLILDKDEIHTTTNSISDSPGYQSEISAANDTSELSLESYPEDDLTESDKSTVFRTSATISEVDIDQLTDDETVTIKDSASTRTFAPDNYDRTLLNLSDQDVSRIFPGMKPEAGAVMTPDYAKKVFLSKSGNVKNHYYKMYAGLGLILMLTVAVWGLFEYQAESDMIDNSLASLKRDPMPGIINPRKSNESTNLFAQPVAADEKARELLSNKIIASNTESNSETESPASSNEPTLEVTSEGDQNIDSSAIQEKGKETNNKITQTALQQSDETTTKETLDQGPTVIASVTEAATRKEAQATQRNQNTRLQVTTTNKADEKAKILTTAYQAYEQGNFAVARDQYDEVLGLDKDNRDALLGRAAIHVIDNEFDQAILNYQKLLLANPKDSMAMTSLISVANIEPQVGESQIKTLLRDQPDTAYLHFALGNMYGNQKRWNEAQTAYFEAHKFKPNDPNYAYNLAVSLEHLGKTDAASSLYQKALDNSSSGLATFDSALVQQRIEVLAQ